MNVNVNVKVNDISIFLDENYKYKVNGLEGDYFQCYLDDNVLLVLDRKAGYYNLYKGGILDLLV